MTEIYSISGFAKAGREGEVKTSDDGLKLKLGAPTKKDGTNNPEQMFSAGYASCFSQALFVIASSHKVDLKEAPVTVTVKLYKTETGFEIKAGVEAVLENVDQTLANTIMKEAHNLCPYSRLIKPDHILFVKVNGQQI